MLRNYNEHSKEDPSGLTILKVMSFHIYLMKMIKLVWYNVNYGGGTRVVTKTY